MDTANQWVELITGIAALLGGVLAAFWAYARMIVERGLFPPSQFDVGCTVVGARGDKQILEIVLLIESLGSSPLIVSNLRVDVRYAETEHADLYGDPDDDRFASVRFPGSLLRTDLHFKGTLLADGRNEVVRVDGPCVRIDGKRTRGRGNAIDAWDHATRGIPLLRYDTFVQAGVKQSYTLITAVPITAVQALVFGSFRYGVRSNALQRAVLRAARWPGVVQFTLEHMQEPHTVQRAFALGAKDGESAHGS